MVEGELLQVVWKDTVTESEWRAKEVAKKETYSLISSLGHFLKQDKEAIWIAGQYSLNGNFVGNIVVIPLGCVKSIKRLEVAHD